MRILLIEDNPKTADAVVEALILSGYLVDHKFDGKEDWFNAGMEPYAAAILDLTSPTIDGLSILKYWRQADVSFPVLILTARDVLEEHVVWVNAGADDYLPKPFRKVDLVDRLRVVIQRHADQESSVLSIGSVSLDSQKMQVTVKGKAIYLSPKEFRLLSYLMDHAGYVASRLELARLLYSRESESKSRAVTVLVARIRRKLGVALIKTRWGFGYVIETTGS